MKDSKLIDQHKRMAMGMPIEQGGGMDKDGMKGMPGAGVRSEGFEGKNIHGGEEISKKSWLKDPKRGLKHMHKHADHGEHEMSKPKDGSMTGSEPSW
jgi:hypothetical protein